MIKHIVMWKLKETDPIEKLEQCQTLKTKLETLKTTIPEIVQIEVGININPAETAFDVALYSLFVTEADLETYQKHPEHLKVREFVHSIISERHVVDYEL